MSVLPPTVGSALSGGGSIPGAIFTTVPDGTIVNENTHYAEKIEVYLDGGPGQNAPQKAASLPDGDYYFQVTDPSGKYLLSEDPAKCRRIKVENGVIVALVPPAPPEPNTYPGGPGGSDIPCHVQHAEEGVAGPAGHHDTNIDADHGLDGNAIVVQLMPFLDTPNKGGVYKAWMIPVDDYKANQIASPMGQYDDTLMPESYTGKDKKMGFLPDLGFGAPGLPGSRNHIKTDNFKVKGNPKCDPPLLFVRKFHDKNMNGVWDQDGTEEEISGWQVTIKNPYGEEDDQYTPVGNPDYYYAMPLGLWTVTEATPEGTVQTAAWLDTTQLLPVDPTVSVTFSSECGNEQHTVLFGNIGLGQITACKYYDENRNGVADPGEIQKIDGWPMVLTGGNLPGPITKTTVDGCATFEDLLPGTYTVTEALAAPPWDHIGEAFQEVTVESIVNAAGEIEGTSETVNFANFCIGTADFDTKGYWHNKNGLQELTQADIDFVNSPTLLPGSPYAAESSYFDAGDEPFNGFFSNGDPVAAAYENFDEIAGEGTAKAEVSHFLVDKNATGDPREQLAQQLLAFIFNVRHRLGDMNTLVKVDDDWVMAGDLIAQAITDWTSGTPTKQDDMQKKLAALNENDAVSFVALTPASCPTPVF